MSSQIELPPEQRNSNVEFESSPKNYVLISVSDKTGIVDFAGRLEHLGYTIISTGGTGRTLTENGIQFTPIQEITGNPEAFDGRMKTISWQVEGGILYDRFKDSHVKQAQKLGLPDIQMVVCNLYPFTQTIYKPDFTMDEAVENIDVGGPTMVRAAAKNHKSVLVVTDPSNYDQVIEAIASNQITSEFRQELAARAFAHLANYDAQIASFLNKEKFPKEKPIPLVRGNMNVRYGDNPDQEAEFYVVPGEERDSPIARLKRCSGREPSTTNLTDIDAGIKVVRMFDYPAAVVIKHNTPCGIACGVAIGDDISEILARALDSDPESAFGGVVVLNRPMGEPEARVIESFKKSGRGQMDIIATPDISEKGLTLISEVRKTTGVYTFGDLPKFSPRGNLIKSVDGGFIVQDENNPEASFPNWKVVTEVQPTPEQLGQMKVGWKLIARIKSNTVLVVDKLLPMVRGIGSGQTSRVRSTKIALECAGEFTKGGILVSDSFFPFADSVKMAIKSGIAAIIQQGGSVNDQQSIDVANHAGIPMVFTGQRLFWH